MKAMAPGSSVEQQDQLIRQDLEVRANAPASKPSVKLATSSKKSAAKLPQVVKNSQTSSGTYLGSPCVSITSANGGQATGKACDMMSLLFTTDNGNNWFISDSINASGHNGTWWNNLTKMYANDNYVGGNNIVEWQPQGFVSTGSCTSYNEGINFFGATVGATQTVCPSGLGPQWSDPTTGAGAQWTGCSGNTQGAPSVDVLNSPPGVSDAMQVRLGLSWAWC
jgi:hypothetical protein